MADRSKAGRGSAPQVDRLAGAQQPNVSNHFAWLRTRMSAGRTLNAWARTAAALIGFGFTIGEFLSRVNTAAAEGGLVTPARYPQLPVALGLTLIAVGTLGLALASVEYVILLRHLRTQFAELADVPGMPRFTPTLAASLVIVAAGTITFIVMVVRFWA